MNVLDTFNTWRRYRNTVSELSRLDNRALADLGITRGTIRQAARKAA